ncbi:universal stress protein [Kitasatospora sp. P5_F3]
MNRTLLVGVDGSPESLAAARWAADEAVRRGADLRIGHVQTWLDDVHSAPGQPADVQALTLRLLDDAAAEVRREHPGLPVATELLVGGDPVDLLAKAAVQAELVVVGSRGLGGFAGLVVGSVGLGVAAHCEQPTVLVRASAAETTGTGRPAEVVVGVDSRTPSLATLEFAFRQAELLGTSLRAVHGWEPPAAWGYAGWVAPQESWDSLGLIETELLDQAVDTLREQYPAVPVVLDARVGTPSGAVVEASGGAALVVVGRRHRPHPFGMHLGPVAHAVIHHAHAPVVVVPHD